MKGPAVLVAVSSLSPQPAWPHLQEKLQGGRNLK